MNSSKKRCEMTGWSLSQLCGALERGDVTSREVTTAYLERIREIDPLIGAYITVTEEKALAAADAADARTLEGKRLSIIDGVPMALKDIFCTKGIKTTCASKILSNFIPPYDASAWARLEEKGAVLLGKVNLDEFAMGSSTESSAFFHTRNPHDTERVPGGSSGGSAASVAADLAAFSLGTDTGGSVRQPAHFCGCVGMKPTYGRVSRYGMIPYASSLDQAGILAKTTEDAAIVLELISGKDEYDSTSVSWPVGQYVEACRRPVEGMRIGLPKEFLAEGIGTGVLEAVREGAEKLKACGAEVVEVSLPHTHYALPSYYILASAEASSNLSRYDGIRYGLRVEGKDLNETFEKTRSQGFGEEVKRRILLGTYALSSGYYDAYYNKTLQVRTLIKRDYDEVFAAGIDCLLTPAAPGTAFKIGEKVDDPLAMYMGDVCTVPVNLAGLPALVVPFKRLDGLPVGLQLIGRPFGEEELFTAGAALECEERLLPRDLWEQAKAFGQTTERGVR